MVVWTYDKQQQLEQQYNQGASIEYIAFNFHLSPYTISKLLHINLAEPYEPYDAPLPKFSTEPFREENYWDNHCHLSEDEMKELEILWEELKF